MLKIAIVVYIFLAPTLMGMAVTALLTVAQFTTDYALIGWVALAGAALAIPGSIFVAKRIQQLTA